MHVQRKVWKYVATGSGLISNHSREELAELFKELGLRITKVAIEVLYQQEELCTRRLQGCHLVRVPLTELGFHTHTSDLALILERAIAAGFVICIPEVGFSVQLTYWQQSERPTATLGMVPVMVPGLGKPQVLAVGCNGGESLYALDVGTKDTERWNPRDEFIFGLP